MIRLGARERRTDVACPSCGDGVLSVHLGCFSARVQCRACRTVHGLADLARTLPAQDFQLLAETIGDRPCDRV